MTNIPVLSIVVPVSERFDEVEPLYRDYKRAIEASGLSHEFIYVLDGEFSDTLAELRSLQQKGEEIKVVRLAKWFGEATALTAGFEQASGSKILTLPAYYQVDPSEIPRILKELDGHDMVVARRWPRMDSRFNQIQTRIFHGILSVVTDSPFKDLGCGVRAFRREVAAEIPLYGDQHRFLPLLAMRKGFRIKELDVAQSEKEASRRVYRIGVYLRRVLDVLTVFFLVKFTKKPLRFFGLVGTSTFVVGGLLLAYLVAERLFWNVPLADRPALLLSSLLVVLGVQVFGLGLIGELIIFTHARDLKEYTVEEVVDGTSDSEVS